MRPNIVTRGFENAQALHEYIRYRLSFALGRTGKDLRAINVRLDDINGPRGGNDKRCTIQLAVPGRPSVIVRTLHNSIHAAIHLAAHRAELALNKLLARERRYQRQPMLALLAE